MTATFLIVLLIVITALAFDFTNGFHDSVNAMATSVATGALKPKAAVLIAAVLDAAGAFLSTEVAKTISGGIVDDTKVTPVMVFAGLIGATLWNLMTWLLGLPSSSSHALFGGLIGAVIVGAGLSGVNFSVVVSKILLPAVIASIVAGHSRRAGHLPCVQDHRRLPEHRHRTADLGDRRGRRRDRSRHLLRQVASHADDGRGPLRDSGAPGLCR